MPFEWDEAKRRSNLAKHGIDFVRAARIFRNPILERMDDRQDYGEERWIAIGHWQGQCLVVVYTWRDGKRRLISAWKAGQDDREVYDDRIFGGSGDPGGPDA
ncbi:MAG: BrnT family toxin [Rhodospirillaceae bacterium]|nr:BrnT family toxin [Rhodospirillaceae bacterium]